MYVLMYPNDALGSDELNKRVCHRALGNTLGVRLDVAEISNVSGLILGGSVGLAVRVDCTKRLDANLLEP